MNPLGRQDGVALLITILVVALMTIVVVEFTYSTEVEAHLTRSALSAMQANYLARAGVALGEIALKLDKAARGKGAAGDVDSLGDPWAQPFPPENVGENVGRAGFVITDESARFNLNALAVAPTPNTPPGTPNPTLIARQQLLRLVFDAVGLDGNLVSSLSDWVDPDDDETGKFGAESKYYLALNPPYVPRNGPLLTLDEVRLVRGFAELAPAQWTIFQSLFTVIPDQNGATINVNTAPEGLLTAIFAAYSAPNVAKAILGDRDQHPFTEATLRQIPGYDELTKEHSELKIFTGKSSALTIHGVGVAGDVTRGYAVTVARDGSKRLAWREEAAVPLTLTSPGPSDGIGAASP